MLIEFIIDDEVHKVFCQSTDLSKGEDLVLSNSFTDATFTQEWFKTGYFVYNLLDDREVQEVKNEIQLQISDIISKHLNIDTTELSLLNYHEFINDEQHQIVASKTRDLYKTDLKFDIHKYIKKFEKLLNIELTTIDPNTQWNAHFIIRINRPNSSDFNPPHKDIYEHFDADSHIPNFINFWLPICGVNKKSSLPVSPGSHLIPESQILRTKLGAKIGNQNYHVRLVANWGNNKLERVNIEPGQILIFTPHLIHGLAINSSDVTRVALEFRLFKK